MAGAYLDSIAILLFASLKRSNIHPIAFRQAILATNSEDNVLRNDLCAVASRISLWYFVPVRA